MSYFEEAAQDGRIGMVPEDAPPPCPKHEGPCELVTTVMPDGLLWEFKVGSWFEITGAGADLPDGRWRIVARFDLDWGVPTYGRPVRELHCVRDQA